MFAVPEQTVYRMNMIDYGVGHWYDQYPSLDRLVTQTYGREYHGQQTGDMLPNDSFHVYVMDEAAVEEYLYVPESNEPFYDPEYGDRSYFGEAGFKMWVDDDKEYDYDFLHYRQAPTPPTALAMLIKDGHLPYGTYLIEVMW